MRRTRALLAAAIALIVPAAIAPAAGADGLPVGGIDVGASGIVYEEENERFVALDAGEQTMVARISTLSGVVRGSRLIDGDYTIPAVAYDGSASGLSADGSTLVLINPRARFPRTHTSLAVLDVAGRQPGRYPRLQEKIELEGDFSFDAVSPVGTTVFLIEYLSRRDPTEYAVRAYDLKTDRLLPGPIVDPEEESGEMYGLPLTRAESPDGRWHYTLYDSAHHPFVHALDTIGMTAVCIDLDELDRKARNHLYQARLEVSPSGESFSLIGRAARGADAETLVEVDTETWAPEYVDGVSAEASAPAPPVAGSAPVSTENRLFSPWLLLLAAIFPGALIVRRR